MTLESLDVCQHCGDAIAFDGIVWIDSTEGDVCGVASADADTNVPHAPENHLTSESF